MRTLLFFVAMAVCASCGPASPQSQLPSTPSLTHDPIFIGQGQTASVELVPSDSAGHPVALSLTSTPDAGLTASLAGDGVTLLLQADYSLSGAQSVGVHLDDGAGGRADVTLSVTVQPLGWQWTTMAGTPGPTAREHGTFIYDADHDVAYLVGGSGYTPQSVPAVDAFWTFDLKARTFTAFVPTGTAPPGGASRRAANLPDQKVAYLFGGYEIPTSDTNDLYRFDYSGTTPVFTKLTQVNAPPARELHAFVYDAVADLFVAFGGFNYESGSALSDTWSMKLSGDTATWTKLAIPGPTPRYGFFYALNPADGNLYLWSGAQNPTLIDSINAAKDLWVLQLRSDQPTWLRLLNGTEPGSIKGRRNGAFVFDPTGPRLIVFGGTADGATTVPGLGILDLGASVPAWSTVTPDSMPPFRSSDFGFFDVTRKQSVIGFGNDAAVYRDVFALGY